ncbi:Septin-7 [Nymphon striatum]|nr:Septin-7 [Nymphon striatum]
MRLEPGSFTPSIEILTTQSPRSLIIYFLPLSSKRDMFFRQDGPPSTTAATAPTSTNATNGTVTSSSTTNSSSLSNSRENILSKRDTTSASREKESSHYSSSAKSVDGYVGFANLPNQVYRKASTLINSMFLTDIYAPDYPGPSMRIKKTVQVETTKLLLKENGVNLTLTVVDTPGFGDAVDNSNCWQPIIDFIENKYEDYLNCESRVNRKIITDNRVHSCLYFIAPSGHGLKPLDIEFMKRLHDKVNIIPLIAKADTMTPEECIAQHKIKIYEFPDCDDEEDNKVQKPLKERVPFAVVGSNTIIDNNGKKIRGRKYPWGVVEVENLEHCDFIALRNMLIRTHMQDLKDVTNSVHYENYRCRKLAGVSQDGKQSRLSNNILLLCMVLQNIFSFVTPLSYPNFLFSWFKSSPSLLAFYVMLAKSGTMCLFCREIH